MELQPGIAGQLAEATQGYPFMIQLVGYYAWQLARRAHTAIIGEEEAERGIATARERFCAMVIEPALQRIPPTCIAYLLSMASLGQTSSTSMVADALNKTPQQVSSVRSRLLREIDYRGSFVRQGLICHPLHARLPLRAQSRTGS